MSNRFAQLFASGWPFFNTPGVPGSGVAKPDKTIIQGIGPALDSAFDTITAAQTSGSVLYDTWTQLSGNPGTVAGGRGEVAITDAGTHTDPVVGGTVANAGQYRWSVSPAGWKWVQSNSSATKADKTTTVTGDGLAATTSGTLGANVVVHVPEAADADLDAAATTPTDGTKAVTSRRLWTFWTGRVASWARPFLVAANNAAARVILDVYSKAESDLLGVKTYVGPGLPDPFRTIIFDKDGREVGGLADDGAWLPTGAGLGRVDFRPLKGDYIIQSATIGNNNDGKYPHASFLDNTAAITVIIGQSLARADKSTTSLGTGETAPASYNDPVSKKPKHPGWALMPDVGLHSDGLDIIDLRDLVEETFIENPTVPESAICGETVASTIINGILDREIESFGRKQRRVVFIAAEGSSTVGNLTAGNVSYTNGIKNFKEICQICLDKGWRPYLDHVILNHGESNAGIGTAEDVFFTQTQEWIENLVADYTAISRQSEKVNTFLYQALRGSSDINGRSSVLWAQRRLGLEPNKTCVGGIYRIVHNPPDGVHTSNYGYEDIGHVYVNAIWRHLYRDGFTALAMEDWWLTSSTAGTIKFNKPCIPDASGAFIRVANMQNPAGLGIDYTQGADATPPKINSLVNVAPNLGVMTSGNEQRGPTPGTSMAGATACYWSQSGSIWVVCADRKSLALIDFKYTTQSDFTAEYVDVTRLNGARDIAPYHGYMLIVNFVRDSVLCLDVSAMCGIFDNGAVLPAPTVTSELQGSIPGTTLDGAWAIVVCQTLAFVSCFNRAALVIIDYADPANPVILSEYRGADPGLTFQNAKGLAVLEDHQRIVYLAVSARNTIAAIDVTDPTAPTTLSLTFDNTRLDGVCALQVFGLNRYLVGVCAGRKSIIVYSLADPKNPAFVAEYQGPVPGTTFDGINNLKMVGTVAYVTGASTGKPGYIASVDLTNPAAPVWIAENQGATPGTTLAGACDMAYKDGEIAIACPGRAAIARVSLTPASTLVNFTLDAAVDSVKSKALQVAQRYTTNFASNEFGARSGMRGPWPDYHDETDYQRIEWAQPQRIARG